MNATARLRAAGQSLWLDDITRELLDSGTLQHYVEQLSVTGLTSNPSIFDHAITHSDRYDEEIRRLTARGYSAEALFFELALEDLSRAADMFRPIHDATAGADGWVSLEVSPLLAYQADETIAEARRLWRRANRPNLFIKIPGTKEGLPAIEKAIAAGVPVNVTLLFSPAQYEAAADAYMRGLEQRIVAGLAPNVHSVASVFISRWDRAVTDTVPAAMQNTLGAAVGQLAYKSYRAVLDSDRWQRLASYGAVPQRLLFASTSMKDPKAPDAFYVNALAAPNTINTMPGPTLLAFADHGAIGNILPRDGDGAVATIAQFVTAGVNVNELAEKLQSDGAQAFIESWKDLLQAIDRKSRALGLPRAA
jgi:transaldolase